MFQRPASISGRLRWICRSVFAKNGDPHLPTLQQYPGIELELSSSDRLVDVIREGLTGRTWCVGAQKTQG